MIRISYRRIWLILFCVVCVLRAGEPKLPTVEDIVQNVSSQFQKVEDYSVTIGLKVDMPHIRMPSKKLQFYFKQPDKIKIKAAGFAIVPKTGLGGSGVELLALLDSARVLRQDNRGERIYWVLTGTINPDSLNTGSWHGGGAEFGREIIITIWVDSERWVIGYIETVVDSVQAFSVSSVYAEHNEGIYLPMVTEILIYTSLLRGMTYRRPSEGPLGDRHDFTEGVSDAMGRIRMEFHNYKINIGLKDEIFLEK